MQSRTILTLIAALFAFAALLIAWTAARLLDIGAADGLGTAACLLGMSLSALSALMRERNTEKAWELRDFGWPLLFSRRLS